MISISFISGGYEFLCSSYSGYFSNINSSYIGSESTFFILLFIFVINFFTIFRILNFFSIPYGLSLRNGINVSIFPNYFLRFYFIVRSSFRFFINCYTTNIVFSFLSLILTVSFSLILTSGQSLNFTNNSGSYFDPFFY